MYRKFIHIFPSDILSITFFRLLLTIKRYYNNRWSFWPGGDPSPPLSYAESPRAFQAAILIRSSLAVGGGGILPKFYAGRFRPEVQSLALLSQVAQAHYESREKHYPNQLINYSYSTKIIRRCMEKYSLLTKLAKCTLNIALKLTFSVFLFFFVF